MMLSIVIPAYNAAETLAATLDSLLAQTRHDWEAIVVDDGSTDTTRQIADDYARRDRRFRFLSDGSLNTGVSNARNRGIAAATGKWLHFLDADDWIEPAFVEKMLRALESRPGAQAFYCSASTVAPDGRIGRPQLNIAVAQAPFETLARECPLLIHAVVVERALVVELGGFDPALRTDEDADLWQRIARTGAAFHAVPDAVVFYRARRGSLSTGIRSRFADGRAVLARGFERDPRVAKPDPRYAEGIDNGRGKAFALAFFALRATAFDIGEGGTGLGLVEAFPARTANLLGECTLRILGGLAAGARLLPGDPLSDDPALLSAVRRLLAEVEGATKRPGLARLLECALEPDIFRPARQTDRLVVGDTLFVRQQVDRLQPIDAPPEAGRLHVEFRKDGRCLGRAETLLFDNMSTHDLTALAIEAVSPTIFLKESGWLRRPRFWLQLGTEVARLPLRRIRASGSTLRLRARDILVRAAQGAAGRRPLAIDRRVPFNATLPILMYHRIADDGPAALARYRVTPESFAAQLQSLRRAGYRAITSRDVLRAMDDGRSLEGRPVLITFDDAYSDFHDVAWPILRAAGMTAEIMVVTDSVGGTADWDADWGAPAPLLDWPQIRSLAAAGVAFGSHMASHSHMADLSSHEILQEAARSRTALEQQLGQTCLSIAVPYGEAEPGFSGVAARCGYRVGFGVQPGWARPGLDSLCLPRIEVQGGWSIDRFEQALSRPRA